MVSVLWKQHQKEDNGNTEKIRNQGEKDTVYEQSELMKLAEEVRAILRVNQKAKEYIERFSNNYQIGRWIPSVEEVVDNSSLRYELICFLCYKTSNMETNGQKLWGEGLIKELEAVEAVSEEKEKQGPKKAAWDTAEFLQELDYFKYAEYMKSGDNTVDPVRRIYTDLMIPKKRQELINYLEDKMPHAKNREKAEALLESLEQLKDQPVKGKSR